MKQNGSIALCKEIQWRATSKTSSKSDTDRGGGRGKVSPFESRINLLEAVSSVVANLSDSRHG